MTGNRDPKRVVGLACNRATRDAYIDSVDLERLGRIAELRFEPFDEPSSWDEAPPTRGDVEERMKRFCAGLDALVVCHGSPRITGPILDAAPRLKFVGELEGDRFARRIDVEAAVSRGVRAVDTTHGSSYPVSEWALGLMLIGLRNAGALFRRLIAHQPAFGPGEKQRDLSYLQGELTGKTIGLIGCGHIGRRLLELLKPFHVSVLVHDPYVPKELADICDVTLTSLDRVLAEPEAVVCLAPLTPGTRGLIGEREIGLLRPNAVFVNVSRGPVVDSNALIARLRRGDLIACLDVFDPEPVPVDSPVRDFENVFLSPHIAGVTQASRTRFFNLMVDELQRFFGGHETRHDLLPRTLANRRGDAPEPR